MGLLLLAILGLGALAISKSKTAAKSPMPTPSPGGATPAVDPAGVNPLLAGPRTRNVAGAIALTPAWNDVAVLRMARYAPGTGQTTIDGLPGGGGAKITGTLTFRDDLKTLTPEQIATRSVIGWATEQNKKGLAIVVSESIVTGLFTEDAAHTTLNNPFLPPTITVMAVPVLALPVVAAPGTGMAVISE